MTVLVEGSWHDARAQARALCSRLGVETVNVYRAAGRVLATNLTARCDLPNANTSAMDGWALSGAGPWHILGDVPAGNPWKTVLVDGEAVRIATGGVLPEGADAVLRWEDAHVDGEHVSGESTPGRDIRRAGEECRAGDVIARDGELVSPVLAGYFAATGHDDILVARRPSVSVLLLGDELLDEGVAMHGMVRDSLGPQLPEWLKRMGASFGEQIRGLDSLDETIAQLGGLAERNDVIITTGGTAAGPRDHLRAALLGLGGHLIIDKVKVRPGHPMLLATIPSSHGDVPVVGLPGNPHSAIVGLLTLGEPIVNGLLGRVEERSMMVPLGEDITTPPDATRLVASRLVDGVAVTSEYGGSAMLRGLAGSTGFAVTTTRTTVAGTLVEWLALPA